MAGHCGHRGAAVGPGGPLHGILTWIQQQLAGGSTASSSQSSGSGQPWVAPPPPVNAGTRSQYKPKTPPGPGPGGKPTTKPGPGGGGKPPRTPPVAGPAHPDEDGECGCEGGGGSGWKWLYHGSQAIFELFNVATAIAAQMARGPSYHPELGYGIYFTDTPSRAGQYMANKATGRIYRAGAPEELINRLRGGEISTNGDPQWVVDNQADADLLNQSIEWRAPVDLITNNPFPPDADCTP